MMTGNADNAVRSASTWSLAGAAILFLGSGWEECVEVVAATFERRVVNRDWRESVRVDLGKYTVGV